MWTHRTNISHHRVGEQGGLTFISAGIPGAVKSVSKQCHIGITCRTIGRQREDVRVHRTRRVSFLGMDIVRGDKQNSNLRGTAKQRYTTKMLVDPWSVSSETIDALAGQLFAASLFPYLGFLYFLGRKEVNCPKLASFGFKFLLVFVFATIPAGIYAKVHYHDILANIDWLHGGAESLLTITNLLIVMGFRKGILASNSATKMSEEPSGSDKVATRFKVEAVPSLALCLIVPLLGSSAATLHAEPVNALSFPTWIIHVSSIIEWLTAMGLVWKYAETSRNSRWKGLTWGMVPLHTSGICACTYHFFYNAPALNGLVALQAGLTCIGNASMAFAAYRIYCGGAESSSSATNVTDVKNERSLPGFEDMGFDVESGGNVKFFAKVFLLSCAGAGTIKWGSLLIDVPFEASIPAAFAIIGVPTALNLSKWALRSSLKPNEGGNGL